MATALNAHQSVGLFDSIVDASVQKVLRRERELLVELRELLEREQIAERRRVEELLEGLDDLFTIVIVGEFNAGKSSLINALFGQKLRKEGPIPVDDRISVLRFGDSGRTARSDFVTEEHYPVEFLRNITLVDTPGTNSIVQRHQEITHDFIPRADLILFVTSIDRPLSESERQFLQYIRAWGKKIVFVLNKVDTKDAEEIEQVLGYLRQNIATIFEFEPTIIPVGAKPALEAKLAAGDAGPSGELWERSRFADLENYLLRTLSQKERIRIKLQAPLDTATTLTTSQLEMLAARREVLRSDIDRITQITSQLELAQNDLVSNFKQFVARVDNLMMDLEMRGVDFLDRYIRIQHIMLLRDASRFREEFERQVFHDWEKSIDRTVQESVDWLVKENMRLWNGTVEEFHRRPAADAASSGLIGRVGKEFAYNREEIYSRIKAEAERRIETYDVGIESRRLIDSAMQAVFHSLGLGAGALGLGYLVTTAFSSVAVDVTGLTAATMLLVTSFLVLPYKRSKARQEFRERISSLRSQLRDGLVRESATEIERMVRHIAGAFEPYERFYATEMQKVDEFGTKLTSIEAAAREIGDDIERVVSRARV